MFGFSFGELVVLIIAAVVVLGPRDLPRVLRTMGQWAGKLRRMAADLRAQSGIDQILHSEGLSHDIAEIRKLARGELDTVSRSMRLDEAQEASARAEKAFVDREREHPAAGADAYGALPESAMVYAGGLPSSPLARDPLYVTGDPDGVVPEPPREVEDEPTLDPSNPDSESPTP